MAIERLGLSAAEWLWSRYGEEIVDKGKTKLVQHWQKFGWKNAEEKYRDRMYSLSSTTRLLGYPKPISIEGIFTDVYILETISSHQRMDVDELTEIEIFDEERERSSRKPILHVLETSDHLYILGKPGCGKTTLLKYLTLRACKGDIRGKGSEKKNRDLPFMDWIKNPFDGIKKEPSRSNDPITYTPIFVSLKEFGDSNLDIMSFIIKQFDICGFPNAKEFVEWLLLKGLGLVLFDGLDEVSQADNRNQEVVQQINEFSKKYGGNRIVITCRIAASEYFFDQFNYVEIADFNDSQIEVFSSKWYQDDTEKYHLFKNELMRIENKNIKELAKTPLLLALLCLAFDESMLFPKRHVDLYKEALDALLKKWDASRGIIRDNLYHQLPHRRKEQLLSHIATQNFVAEKIYFRKQELIAQIEKYLEKLPPGDLNNLPVDGEFVLKSIEAQHGLLVERARGIYSFSHLTFQEFFVAKYVVDNMSADSLNDLFDYYRDSRWREVIIDVASLLDTADSFFALFIQKLRNLIEQDPVMMEILHWVEYKLSRKGSNSDIGIRGVVFFIALAIARYYLINNAFADSGSIYAIRRLPHALRLSVTLLNEISSMQFQAAIGRKMSSALNVSTADNIDVILGMPKPLYVLAKAVDVELKQEDFDNKQIRLGQKQVDSVLAFLNATRLMHECLELSVVTNREKIKSQLISYF